MRIVSIWILGFTAVHANAAPTECVNDRLRRTIEIVYAEPGQAVPCEVVYERARTDADEKTSETLWRAVNESGYCESKAQSLVANLESMGWQCRPVEDTAPVSNPSVESP